MPELRLTELCDLLATHGQPAKIDGPDCLIKAVNTLEAAGEGEISFLANPKYASALAETGASAVLVRNGEPASKRFTAVRCDDPYAAVAIAVVAIHGYRKHPQWGISERATIHQTATVGEHTHIAHDVTIAAGASVGDGCTLYPGCYVADGARIGHGCVLHPNVVIYDGCELGDRVVVHAGTIIGEDGLGYAPVGETWVKIPQTGRVVVGDDVEIGANCTIDRATLGTTEIGSGTKFGNAIVIGHGAKVGPHCLFVGQLGVAGSARIGRHVTLSGQVGIDGHLEIGDNAAVGGQSNVTADVAPNAKMLGTPATDIDSARRSIVAVRKLPAWLHRIKELERRVAELQERIDAAGRA